MQNKWITQYFRETIRRFTVRNTGQNQNENELKNFDTNNIEFQTFENIFLSILNQHVALKPKYLRANS